jgi:transcription antitermination factor NusG
MGTSSPQGNECSNSSDRVPERRWYAVYTLPQNEKSAIKQLDLRQVESFLPTYESVRVWKNRQRVKVTLPLFPTYLFVHIKHHERLKVLQSPGVLQIVGNGHMPLPLPDADIDFLRSDFCRERAEPYFGLTIGQKVRVRSGPMEGVEGVLVRRNNGIRFVLSIGLISQHAAVEVSGDDLEPI